MGKITFCVRGVISPLLANIYLHYSFDLWVNVWRRKYAQGEVVVIRFADDSVPRVRKAERLA
jgi:retron-type reverse transcriptase